MKKLLIFVTMLTFVSVMFAQANESNGVRTAIAPTTDALSTISSASRTVRNATMRDPFDLTPPTEIEVGALGTPEALEDDLWARWAPFCYEYRNSISQSMYLATDVLGDGTLAGKSGSQISFIGYEAILMNTGDFEIPMSIWLANTTDTAFPVDSQGEPLGYTSATSATATFTRVVISETYMLPLNETNSQMTTYMMWFRLATPFAYTGGSLVVATQRHNTASTYTESQNVFHVQEVEDLCVLDLQVGYTFPNAFDMEEGYSSAVPYRPTLHLGFGTPVTGTATGIVKNAGGTALSGIKIEVLNHGFGTPVSATNNLGTPFTTTTGGAFSLANVLPANSIKFSGVGYVDTIVTTTDVASLAMGDVTITSMGDPLVVSGIVTFNTTGGFADGAVASLTGYGTFTPVTIGSTGAFSFSNVYPGNEYTLTVSHKDYVSYSNTWTPTPTTNTFDNIVLVEFLKAPENIRAEVTTEGNVKLTWNNPAFGSATMTYATGAATANFGATGAPYVLHKAYRFNQAKIADFSATGFEVTSVGVYLGPGATTLRMIIVETTDRAIPHNDAALGLTMSNNRLTGSTIKRDHTFTIDVSSSGWYDHILETPYPMPTAAGTAFWVIYEVYGEDAAGQPFAVDGGPGVAGFGDIIRSGGSWVGLPSIGADRNFLIRVDAQEPDPDGAPAPVMLTNFDNPSNVHYSLPIDERASFVMSNGDISFPDDQIVTPSYRSGNRAYFDFQNKYIIYRGTNAQANQGFLLPTNVLNAEFTPPAAGRYPSYTDNTWSALPTSTTMYRYGIKAIHEPVVNESTPRIGELGLSNIIAKNTSTFAVTIAVKRQDNDSVAGTSITLTNLYTGQVYGPQVLTSTTTSHQFTNIPNVTEPEAKQYQISVNLADYAQYTGTHTIAGPGTITITLIPVNTLLALGFNTAEPITDLAPYNFGDWANLDADSDTYFWKVGNERTEPIPGRPAVMTDGLTNNYSVYSESFCRATDTCLYPDNWLISPVINVPEVTGSRVNLSYWLAAYSTSSSRERVLVYVTTNVASATKASFVTDATYTYDPNEAIGSTPWNNETLHDAAELLDASSIPAASGISWIPFNHDLTAYQGEAIRIAFRHSHSSDQYIVRLDDIKITQAVVSTTTVKVLGRIVGTDGTGISGVSVALSGSITGANTTTDGDGKFTFPAVAANNIYTLTATKANYSPLSPHTIVVTDIDYPTTDYVMQLASSDGDDTTPVLATALRANYPNPFNPTTTIAFDMVKDGHVAIDIFNIRGQKVKTLLNDVKAAGPHTVTWNGTDDSGRSVSSGIYFYRMSAEKYSSIKKMVLMK